jgi:hypothetical protein
MHTVIRDMCIRDMGTAGTVATVAITVDIVAITDTDITVVADDMSEATVMRVGAVGTDTGTGS